MSRYSRYRNKGSLAPLFYYLRQTNRGGPSLIGLPAAIGPQYFPYEHQQEMNDDDE